MTLSNITINGTSFSDPYVGTTATTTSTTTPGTITWTTSTPITWADSPSYTTSGYVTIDDGKKYTEEEVEKRANEKFLEACKRPYNIKESGWMPDAGDGDGYHRNTLVTYGDRRAVIISNFSKTRSYWAKKDYRGWWTVDETAEIFEAEDITQLNGIQADQTHDERVSKIIEFLRSNAE